MVTINKVWNLIKLLKNEFDLTCNMFIAQTAIGTISALIARSFTVWIVVAGLPAIIYIGGLIWLYNERFKKG